jgi:hypothetical protein
MSPSAAGLAFLLVLATVPPLIDDDRARLAGAVDGGGDHADAFEALVGNVSRWTPGVGDALIRLDPDLDRLQENPAAYRGELFRIAGILDQQSWLPTPHAAIAEWFVRDDAGRPILVYVYGLPSDHEFQPGQPVTLPARFYRRVAETARDGRVHQYPAFVGAFPQPVRVGAGLGQLWIAIVAIAVLLVVFLALVVFLRRSDRSSHFGPRLVMMETDPGETPLPDDPAEALAELRRRAEAQES